MRDEDDRPVELLDRGLEAFDRLEVEVVRRLVEDEEVRAAEHQEEQLQPSALAAGEHRFP